MESSWQVRARWSMMQVEVAADKSGTGLGPPAWACNPDDPIIGRQEIMIANRSGLADSL